VKLKDRFTGLPLAVKIGAYVISGLVAIFIAARLIGALQIAIFGNVEAKHEHGNAVVAQEQGRAAKETGIEAANTVTRTYEYHTTVDRTVKENQNAVNRADKGQQMDPAIDAAVAAGLCRLHDDLCRRSQ
jgi:hypothetical protein